MTICKQVRRQAEERRRRVCVVRLAHEAKRAHRILSLRRMHARAFNANGMECEDRLAHRMEHARAASLLDSRKDHVLARAAAFRRSMPRTALIASTPDESVPERVRRVRDSAELATLRRKRAELDTRIADAREALARPLGANALRAQAPAPAAAGHEAFHGLAQGAWSQPRITTAAEPVPAAVRRKHGSSLHGTVQLPQPTIPKDMGSADGTIGRLMLATAALERQMRVRDFMSHA